MRKYYLQASSILAGLTLAVMPAVAQVGLEEIVVTARKVQENLMEVPMSIAAVTAADIQASGVKDLSALSLYTPGLWAEYQVAGPGSNQRVLTFRGLSVSSGLIFIDGAPYAGSGTPSVGSVDRVEVLVGPQSAYFGRSTFQGAVNFVTKEPGDTFSGQVNAEIASFGTTDDSLSLDLPILGDKLAARVTGRHFSTNGDWRNAADTSETMGAQSQDSVMGVFVAKPNDALKMKLLLGWENEETTGSPKTISLYGNDPQPGAIRSLFCNLGGTFGPYYCGALPTADQVPPAIISATNVLTPTMQSVFFDNILGWPTLFDRRFKTSIGFRQVTTTAHLNIDYSLASGWDISSIAALHKTQRQSVSPQQFRDARYTVNPNYPRVPLVTPYLGTIAAGQEIQYDGSEEIRVTSPQRERLRGTVGANWYYTRNPGSTQGGFQPATVALIGSQARAVTSTPAVFGGIYYDLIEKLTVSAEARYQWDKISATAKTPAPGPLLQSTYKSFSPRVTLDYKYAPNSTAYALWSRGYRPGGFNTTLVGQPASTLAQLSAAGAGTTYEQEKLDNFEIGLKSTWMGNRLQTRIDGYLEKWRNGQITQTLNANTPTGGVFVASLITNIGAVDLRGIEAEANAAITDHFSVKATFNWQDSKIKQYVSVITLRINNSTQVNGNKFPKAPLVTWTLTPTYTDHLAGDWDWFARADWKHRGKYYTDVSNVAWLDANDLFDLHIGVKNKNLMLEIYGSNLTNDMHFLTAAQGNDTLCCSTGTTVNGIHLALPNKRAFGIKGSYSF